MKSPTSTAIVALVAGTIGFAAFTPVAIAQEAPRPGQHFEQEMQMGHGQFGDNRIERMRNARGPGGRGTLLNLVCSDEGAERAEIGFVRFAYRLELTPEQQTLFDDLKSATLTAQTQFADQCAQPAAATAEAPATAPNPVERLTAQLGNDTIRLELMQGLLPKLEAFYNSLTDEQRATLQPQPGDNKGFRHRRGELPAQPGQPAAPTEPAAPGVEPTALLIG